MPRPVYLLLGLCLPSVLPSPLGTYTTALCVAILAASALAMWAGQPWAKNLNILGIVALGVMVATDAGNRWTAQQLPEGCWRRNAIVTGVIADFPERTQFGQGSVGQNLTLRVHNLEPSYCGAIDRIQLNYWDLEPELTLGQRVILGVQLRPAPAQLSPGSIPDQARNAGRGISARGTVNQVIEVAAATSPLAYGRQRLSQALTHIDTSSRSRNILSALLVGRGGAVGRDDWQRVRALGLSHVLVISGLHVGLVFGLCWWLIRRGRGLLPRAWPALRRKMYGNSKRNQ